MQSIIKNDVTVRPGQYRLRPIGSTKRRAHELVSETGKAVLVLDPEELARMLLDGTIDLIDAF